MHGSVGYEQCADPGFVGHQSLSFYCIVSKNWIAENLPTAESHGMDGMDELLNDKGLDLNAANGTETPYEEWIEVSFKLATSDDKHGMSVPS